MKYIFIFLLFLSTLAAAQRSVDTLWLLKSLARPSYTGQLPGDLVWVKRFMNDTLDFTPITDKEYPAQVKPSKNVLYWELDRIGWFSHPFLYTNLFRSSFRERNFSESNVLEKSYTGFFSDEGFTWYISLMLQNGATKIIATPAALDSFFNRSGNPFNALLWLTAAAPFELKDRPMPPLSASYKKVRSGWLLMLTLPVKSCPISHARVLYFVNRNKRLVFIRMLELRVSNAWQ